MILQNEKLTHRVSFSASQKSLAEFRRQSGEKSLNVFDRDMCVVENTYRSANARIVHLQRTMRALQQAAAFSKKWHSHFFDSRKSSPIG